MALSTYCATPNKAESTPEQQLSTKSKLIPNSDQSVKIESTVFFFYRKRKTFPLPCEIFIRKSLVSFSILRKQKAKLSRSLTVTLTFSKLLLKLNTAPISMSNTSIIR